MRNENGNGAGCGCMLLALLFNLALGGFSFDYCLWFVFGKDIPWYADAVCGIFLAEITVPGMIVCWILNLCGVGSPLIG